LTKKVIISLLAYTAASAGESHRRDPVQPGAAEDHAGSDYADRVRAVCDALHGPAVQARLHLGGAVPGRRGLLHLPQLSTRQTQALRQDFRRGITLRRQLFCFQKDHHERLFAGQGNDGRRRAGTG